MSDRIQRFDALDNFRDYGDYASAAGRRVVAGRLFRADLVHLDVVEVATVGPAIDPRPDPTARRIAYTSGRLT